MAVQRGHHVYDLARRQTDSQHWLGCIWPKQIRHSFYIAGSCLGPTLYDLARGKFGATLFYHLDVLHTCSTQLLFAAIRFVLFMLLLPSCLRTS